MLVTTVGLAVPLAITALMTVLLTIGYAVHPSSKIEALGLVHRHGPSDRGGGVPRYSVPALASVTSHTSIGRMGAMAEIPESHRDLLQANVATLATVGKSGFPQVSAIWFLHDDDGMIRLSLNTARQKVQNLQQRPECTLFIVDPASPMRTLEIRARAEIQPDPDYAFADKVGKKYGGVNLRTMDKPGETRVAITLHPVRVVAVDLTRR
jgi:PPOX class probable F420-dependent enzyme